VSACFPRISRHRKLPVVAFLQQFRKLVAELVGLLWIATETAGFARTGVEMWKRSRALTRPRERFACPQ